MGSRKVGGADVTNLVAIGLEGLTLGESMMTFYAVPGLRSSLVGLLTTGSIATATLWLSLVGIVSTTLASDLLDQLQPGHWVEVPNSRMRDVAPSPLPRGNTGLDAVTSAWSGGAFDTTRNRLLIWGGGHADYSGNEIYGFDVDTLTWEIVENPTPISQIPRISDPTKESYPDGKPAARHTYDGLVYLPAPYDALWEQGGSLAWGGDATWGTWQYDLSQSKWNRKANASSGFASTYGVNAQYDPLTGNVIWRDSFQGDLQISEYDPSVDRWTPRVTGTGLDNDATVSALDPNRRLMIMMGSDTGGYVPDGHFFVYHIDTHQLSEPVTFGGDEIISSTGPGVAYDPVSDRIVAWKGGSDVFTLDLDSFVWTRIVADPSNVVTPTAPIGQGTFGRWQYVPSEDVFIVYNNVRDNVFFYRLPSSVPEPNANAILLTSLMFVATRRNRRRRCGGVY